jgi:hypothetical protein
MIQEEVLFLRTNYEEINLSSDDAPVERLRFPVGLHVQFLAERALAALENANGLATLAGGEMPRHEPAAG